LDQEDRMYQTININKICWTWWRTTWLKLDFPNQTWQSINENCSSVAGWKENCRFAMPCECFPSACQFVRRFWRSHRLCLSRPRWRPLVFALEHVRHVIYVFHGPLSCCRMLRCHLKHMDLVSAKAGWQMCSGAAAHAGGAMQC
jgi:hypothetical protein